MRERPIFIVGTQRSGTTLLRLILDSHDRIAIGHESGFMRAVEATKRLPNYVYGDGWYRRFGIDDDEMNRRLRDFYSSIFDQHARLQGKPRWGEKTPDNIFLIEEIFAMWPEAQFLCTIRHPGAVVASLARWNWEFDRGLDYWLSAYAATQRARHLGESSWLQVRYEDLVVAPRVTLARVLEYLNEPWSNDLLLHDRVQSARGGPEAAEGDTRKDRPIDTESLDTWRSQLSPQQLSRIELTAGEALRMLGYDMSVARA
jgi:hypothetical protein